MFDLIYTMLTDDEVRHTAKLARLQLKDDEVKKFGGQLSKVLEYIALFGIFFIISINIYV